MTIAENEDEDIAAKHPAIYWAEHERQRQRFANAVAGARQAGVSETAIHAALERAVATDGDAVAEITKVGRH